MHYKNGREAKVGDPAIAKNYDGSVVAGTLHSLNPGAKTCNAQLAYPIPGGCSNICVTLGEIYHAGEAFEAMEPQGVAEAAR
jgi:hypothetical protein